MASLVQVGRRWRAQVRLKGHPSTSRTFDTKREAVAWAKKVEKILRSDQRPPPPAIDLSKFPIPALIERYEDEVGVARPFGRSKIGVLRMLSRHFTHDSLASLDEAAIIRYAKKRTKDGAGPVTVALELSYLGTVLRVAKGLWKLPTVSNPIADARPTLRLLGLIGRSQERDRRPTEAEIDALCALFDSRSRQHIPMSAIIRFAIASAMRLGEITSLRWADIDYDDRTIVVRDRKHPLEKLGNNQVIPLLGDAFSIALNQRPANTPANEKHGYQASISGGPATLVFPYNPRSISSLFTDACRTLGIKDLRFHDLRHDGISRMFELGFSIPEVALVSGHRDWAMLRRYTQIRARDLHSRRERLLVTQKSHQ